MTLCPDFDRLDAAVIQGLPGAMDRLDAHIAGCAACAAEMALADDDSLGDLLAPLATVTCPPHVVEAALVAARAAPRSRARATDRPVHRPAQRRLASWTWALAAALAFVAIGIGQWPSGEPTPADAPDAIAEARPSSLTPPAMETPATPPGDVSPPPPAPVSTPDASPPERDAVAPQAPPRMAEPPSPSDPLLRPVSTDALATGTPTAADSVAALDAAYLALELVGRARQTTREAVSPELRRAGSTLATYVL